MAAIDSTPLSASSMERRNSLEKHLQLRPEAQDLRNRHILQGEEVAPEANPPARADVHLRRQSTTDSLERQLEKRPEKNALIERNILPSGTTTTAAPALQAQARELQRNMVADNLEQKVRNRPGPDELIAQGILDETEDPREPSV